jgi:hypothetical protein
MQGGPFPHAEEAERERGGQKFRIETLARFESARAYHLKHSRITDLAFGLDISFCFLVLGVPKVGGGG